MLFSAHVQQVGSWFKQSAGRPHDSTETTRFGLALFLLSITPLAVFAQSSNGSIAGDVTDNTGGALPGALASGWTISAIASYQTGYPYSPTVSADLNNDGNPSNDLAPGHLRNSLRLPSMLSIDPRITRDIPLFGASKRTLIVEACNVTNRHNITGVNKAMFSYNSTTQVLTPVTTFGVPSATAGRRIVQLAGKLTFEPPIHRMEKGRPRAAPFFSDRLTSAICKYTFIYKWDGRPSSSTSSSWKPRSGSSPVKASRLQRLRTSRRS